VATVTDWLGQLLGQLNKSGSAAATEAAPTKPAAAAPANPYQPAADRLRQTTTWLAATLAGVAAIMLAGSQLSSIGSISVTADPVRLIIAIASALIAIAAVGWAIYVLTNIQMPSEGTLGPIREAAANPNSRLAKLADADSGLRNGRPTLTAFLDEYQGVRQQQCDAERDVQSAMDRVEGAQTDDEKAGASHALTVARAHKQRADARIAELRPTMVELAQLVSYISLRDRFSAGRRWVFTAALIAAASLVCFAWAANPSQPKASAAVTVPQSPSAGRLVLTPAGKSQLAMVLGRACATSAATPAGVAVLALARTGGSYDVVIVPRGRCPKPVRVTISADLGRVVAMSAVSLPSARSAKRFPSAGRLVLTPAGKSRLAAVLGHACATSAATPAGVAVLTLARTGGSYDVVIVARGPCPKPVRVTISAHLGRVVPSVLVPSPAASSTAGAQ
jgi:hypothetical protein